MDLKVRVCSNRQTGKTLIIPLVPKKRYNKLLGFLRNYYLKTLSLEDKTIEEMLDGCDNIIFTKNYNNR